MFGGKFPPLKALKKTLSTMNLGFYCHIYNFAVPITKLIRQMLETYLLHSE